MGAGVLDVRLNVFARQSAGDVQRPPVHLADARAALVEGFDAQSD